MIRLVSMMGLAASVLLSACGGATQVNELRFNQNGDGTFTGSAGAAWSEAEIRAQACQGAGAATLSVTSTASGMTFSGRCGSGGDVPSSEVPTVTSAVTSAVTAAPATSSAGWDGSTPFVD